MLEYGIVKHSNETKGKKTVKNKKFPILIIAILAALVLAFSGCTGKTAQNDEKQESAVEKETAPEEEKEESEEKKTEDVEEDTEETSEASVSQEAEDPSDSDPAAGDDGSLSASISEESTESSEVKETSSEEISPGAQQASGQTLEDLIILTDPWEYYYTDMLADAQTLTNLYSGLVTMDSIGITADGRELLHFVVGNPSAEKQVFINGTTHAREYLTTQLVMKQMAVYLQHVAGGDYYGDISYQDMWNEVAVHVVPCVNPDGMTLSQFGLAGMNYEDTVQAVYSVAAMDGAEISDYYLQTWKANALGTDINRNYDALWEEYVGAGHPSSEMYKGEYPGSCAEAAAMINLTLNNNFLRTISYHTQGSIIYWNFYNVENFYDEAYGFATALSQTTGYPLWDDYQSIDALAYSDWGNYRLSIPSVTIECGYGEPPYMQDQFQTIWAQNQSVWEVTVLSVM